MATQLVGQIPLERRPINSHIPCESCGYRRSKVKLTLNPPGNRSVTHRLCKRCDPSS